MYIIACYIAKVFICRIAHIAYISGCNICIIVIFDKLKVEDVMSLVQCLDSEGIAWFEGVLGWTAVHSCSSVLISKRSPRQSAVFAWHFCDNLLFFLDIPAFVLSRHTVRQKIVFSQHFEPGTGCFNWPFRRPYIVFCRQLFFPILTKTYDTNY